MSDYATAAEIRQAMRLHYREPAALEITEVDGVRRDLLFADRWQAETYLSLIPLLQMEGDESACRIRDAQIRGAV